MKIMMLEMIVSMDQERRIVIIREIERWRRGKLLPDQYCDFLLNLYIENPEEREQAGIRGKAAAAVGRSSGKQWLIVFAIFSFISLIALYFSVFPPVLQIGVTGGAVVALLYIGLRLRERHEPTAISLIGLAMFTLLASGLYILFSQGYTDWGYTAGYIGFCAVFWILFGLGSAISTLHFAGWAAAILVYALLLYQQAQAPGWYEVQLFWVPMACLFLWLSWFVKRWNKPASAVMIGVGALLWMMPEIYSALLLEGDLRQWLPIQWVAKLAIGGGLLFALRKKWIAWVA